MTKIIFIMLSVASLSVMADNIDAPGHVFYKMPKGELVKRDATLSVPVKGEGKVYLKAGGKTVEAHAFTAIKSHGRTVFYVVFLNPPGTEKGTAAVLRGTYMRGTNAAVYYGDFFSKKYVEGEQDRLQQNFLDDEQDQGQQQQQDHSEWKHQGGFGFAAKVQ